MQFWKVNEKLPSKNKFYSLLRGKESNNNEYQHVFKVWIKLEMKTMRDCQDLYLKWDVLLLVDVFEKFKSKFIRNYSLCPSHYLSALTLCWDTMLVWLKLS